MSKRKPSFRVDQVLPDDDRLGARSNTWRTHMDRYGFFRYFLWQVATGHVMRLFRSVYGWFGDVLGVARKRKLEPVRGSEGTEDTPGEPPPKFSKTVESVDVDLSAAISSLDYCASDDSLISDVEESGGEDSDQENREELNKQLVQVVNRRKPVWQRNGLQKLMASIEDPHVNMLSHEKVENWLLNRSAAAGSLTREISQGQETTILEKTDNGDRVKFHRKQHLTVSTKDDEDSLYSVDTARYILSNKNKNSRSQIKVYKQIIKHYTMISKDPNAPNHPKLHSISEIPVIPEESLSLSAAHADARHRSDSAIETGGTSMEQLSKLVNDRMPSKSSAPTNRKKVFKKTMKKKPTAKERSVSPAKPRVAVKSPPAQIMERALRNGAKVKKVEVRQPKTAKNRRIHWKETSISERSMNRSNSEKSDDSSSEDEDNNEVFTRSKSRQKTPPKSRRRPTRRINESSASESSPPKPPQTPPRRQPSPPKPSKQARGKNLDKDLVAPFEAISLSSPRKQLDLTTHNPIDQTTNMTALFSGANEKITNSTEINATTSNPGTSSFANSTATNRANRIPGFPDRSRCLVIYEPPQIQPELASDARIRIQMPDLNLAGVTKSRHLKKFTKFSYLIHPNSSVHFFPSDSEEDEPTPAPAVSVNSSDEDISFDDDDPILTFNPRFTDRLNVVEVRHD